MHLPDVKRLAGQFLEENASSILTAGGVIGVTMTAVLTGKASYKAGQLIQQEEERLEVEMSTTEKVKMVWPSFIPPVALGAATIGSIVAANMMSAKRAAALAAAYGISERNLREYKEKTLEKLGVNKERAL